MNKLVNYILIGVAAVLMSGCATKSYIGKVDVVAVGAGAKSESSNKQSIRESELPDVVVAYTPKLKISEQNVSDTTKYVAGEALLKSYSGEPKFIVDYLNAYQKFNNKVIILDKNGVVAWVGQFKSNEIDNAQGVYDYGITGTDRMSFKQAMEKFVFNGDTTDFDEEKKIEFPKDIKETLLTGFSYSKKHPLLFTKLPDMKVNTSKGDLNLSDVINNNKPTVLMFYMSKEESKSLIKDIGKAAEMLNMFKGAETLTKENARPHEVLKKLEDSYFIKE